MGTIVVSTSRSGAASRWGGRENSSSGIQHPASVSAARDGCAGTELPAAI